MESIRPRPNRLLWWIAGGAGALLPLAWLRLCSRQCPEPPWVALEDGRYRAPDGPPSCPSGANGIVGIKPTLGLVSRAGVVPISAEQDTAGPMTRNVTDAAWCCR